MECERSSWKWRGEVERGENVIVGEVNPIRCAFPILPFISFLPALLHPFTHAAGTAPLSRPLMETPGGFPQLARVHDQLLI